MNTLAPTLLLLTLTACASAQPQGSGTPGSVPVSPGNEAEQTLTQIENATKDLNTLRAKITLTTEQGLLGDTQKRFGTLIYDAADETNGDPARFNLTLDRVIIDGNLDHQNRAYIFDGHWLAEKLEDQKLFIRRELTPEGEKGPSLDIGEGPFVLPLNLKRDKVLQRFGVAQFPPNDDDPENALHLKLIPKPEVDIDETEIDVWFDEKTLVPVRVVTLKSDETTTTIDLRDTELNPDLKEATFDTNPPKGGDWEVEIKPLEQPQ